MYDAVANVGVTGCRITAVTTQPISGAEATDATGLVVSAGFSDTYFHGGKAGRGTAAATLTGCAMCETAAWLPALRTSTRNGAVEHQRPVGGCSAVGPATSSRCRASPTRQRSQPSN